jgi:hypothetical protein
MVASLARKAMFEEVFITNVSDIVPIFNLAGYLATWLLHVHTAFKRTELLQLINGYNLHVEHWKRNTYLSFHHLSRLSTLHDSQSHLEPPLLLNYE